MQDILVLAHNQDGHTIDRVTRQRCRAALEHVNLQKEECRLIFAAGRFPGMSEDTLGKLMADHVCGCGYHGPLLVNYGDDEVCSTLKEFEWTKAHLPETKVLKVVTNKAHYMRARVIATRWFGLKTKHVKSPDKTSLLHEVLGYAKLLAYRLGFGQHVEQLRRQYYRG